MFSNCSVLKGRLGIFFTTLVMKLSGTLYNVNYSILNYLTLIMYYLNYFDVKGGLSGRMT